MKAICRILLLLLAALRVPVLLHAQQGYAISQVPLTDVHIKDTFWSAWLKTHAQSILPTCIMQMRDSTERINNFKRAAGVLDGPFKGMFKGTFFDDSDVYKAMEGMAYSLQSNPDPKVRALLEEWIGYIAKAQEPGGYLNTFFELKHDPDYWPDSGRWTDMGRHEMYCGGHMIEAAVAYYNATSDRSFLNVATKFSDYLMSVFGPGKRRWACGHQEIELALVKLYHATGNKSYLDFSHWLLEQRGTGLAIGPMWAASAKSDIDCQNDIPVKDISDVKGHAVRATYMYSAMADVAANTKDNTYLPALNRVWDDVVQRNMYITGAIGSSNTNEGFVGDYDLPNKTSYCETCASVGMVFWNSRMNLMTGDAKYADVMERSMYNAVLGGVSLAGNSFFYVNPMESDGNAHRQRWFGTACCPSNISRFLPSVGSYVYAEKGDEVFVNLYMTSDSKVKMNGTNVSLSQQTAYPWDGAIKIQVNPEQPVNGKIKLRIPEWCKNYSVSVNGKKVPKTIEKGYWTLTKKWATNDVISINLAMPVNMVAADPKVKADVGRRAVQRGPIVYCAEYADNKNLDLNAVTLSSSNKFNVVKGDGILQNLDKLTTTADGQTLTLIPYYAWDNREAGKMIVWMNYAGK